MPGLESGDNGRKIFRTMVCTERLQAKRHNLATLYLRGNLGQDISDGICAVGVGDIEIMQDREPARPSKDEFTRPGWRLINRLVLEISERFADIPDVIACRQYSPGIFLEHHHLDRKRLLSRHHDLR